MTKNDQTGCIQTQKVWSNSRRFNLGYRVFSKVTYWFYLAHSLVLAFPLSCHATLGKEGPSSESVALRDRERGPEEDHGSSYLFILGSAAIG